MHLIIPPLDFLSGGSDRAKQVVTSFVSDGELWSYSIFFVLVRTPSEEEGDNHPLVKPRRGGQVT